MKKNLLTALIISPVIFLCVNCNTPVEQPNATSFIPKDSANKMIGSYLNSINYQSNDTDLYSFIIDMDQVRLYDKDARDSNKITHIKIMLAHTLDYINSGNQNKNAGYKSNALTVVLAGYNRSGEYVYFQNDLVVDHSSPCPHNCPTGNAGNPFISNLSPETP